MREKFSRERLSREAKIIPIESYIRREQTSTAVSNYDLNIGSQLRSDHERYIRISLNPRRKMLEATKLFEGGESSLEPQTAELEATTYREGDQILGLDPQTAKLKGKKHGKGNQMLSVKLHAEKCSQTKFCKGDHMSSLESRAKKCSRKSFVREMNQRQNQMKKQNIRALCRI